MYTLYAMISLRLFSFFVLWQNEIPSVSAVMRFLKALTFIQQRYPFSKAFGVADSREMCVESAQAVYKRLMTNNTSGEPLHFETIVTLAMTTRDDYDDDEADCRTIDPEKAKALIKLFRPDRQGFLTTLDFVKSVDAVYREFRLVNATIDNASQIDCAFENMFNVAFYALVIAVVLSQMGVDPLALFLSLSSIILAFAFMIGSASAKHFEGVLFILARRPYGIGDLISVGPVDDQRPSLDGSLPWVVQNVTLFETVVTLLATNETASLSNGALANIRIINFARSPQAQFHIILHFPLDTPYEKLLVFKTAIEEYMKARPREWRALNGFRVNRVFANQNYLEFYIVIQHREAWQEIGLILDSKANLTSYCQEVALQLGLQYQAPVLPVEVRQQRQHPSHGSGGGIAAPPPQAPQGEEGGWQESIGTDGDDALTRAFQGMARTKHKIRVC
jgi:Mechanosensitive ion channel